jgi:hypothetical protein
MTGLDALNGGVDGKEGVEGWSFIIAHNIFR